MDAKECLKMLREIKDVAFATVDEKGLPQVRMIDVMIAEEEKLYFCTSRGKDFHRQLERDGHVAVTGMNPKYQMIRLNGKARMLENQKAWIDRIFEENPSMNQVYPGDSRYILDAFCIDTGQVEFFDLGTEPIERETFEFGNGEKKEKGFFITEDCIQCGACEKACPQQCIRDFEINQRHCLHCGLCNEVCPVGAVKRKGE